MNLSFNYYFCHTAICEDGCIHGKCVGPNRCECDKGWTGATCDRGKSRSLNKIKKKGKIAKK